jgi:methionyl-tRNA formyltransferase
MRVVFAGTPEFARTALEALVAAGFTIPLVLTQPDRPAGRGMRLQPSAVKQFAAAHGIDVAQPRSLRLDGKYPEEAAAARSVIEAADADAIVVAAYGLILPEWVLDQPCVGCLNIHASLLPRWRGAAPIQRAIEAGDGETGVTIMQMDAGLDTGDMLLAEAIAISPQDSAASLHDRLATIGGRLIVAALNDAARGASRPLKQPTEGVTYARKIEKAEAALDWTQPAEVLERKIRALDPAPGAASAVGGESLKLWKARTSAQLAPAGALPGTILASGDDAVAVACGTGVLHLTELQRPGGKRLAVADFRRGFRLAPGMVFGILP